MEQAIPFMIVGLFPIFWATISLVLSLIGGWATLAKQYPDLSGVFGEAYVLRSGSIGTVRYNSCLNLGVSERGLQLSVLFLFRIGHPPLFIPWEAFHNIVASPTLFGSWTEADVGDPAIAHVMLPAWVFDHLPAKMKTP